MDKIEEDDLRRRQVDRATGVVNLPAHPEIATPLSVEEMDLAADQMRETREQVVMPVNAQWGEDLVRWVEVKHPKPIVV